MQMNHSHSNRKLFLIVSWIFFAAVFAGLIVYLSTHVVDLLDSDMSSEMVLAKQLSSSGKVLSDQWYYSTEIRALNSQLVYSFFFQFFDDWQLVRILGNVFLYLALLASYFFLCKRLKMADYFPVTAAIMLLPLSAPYFYILLFGAYYTTRITIMFLLLGLLIPQRRDSTPKIVKLIEIFVIIALSLALALEGARMVLVLFLPLAALVALEVILRLVKLDKRDQTKFTDRFQCLIHSDTSTFFIRSVISCFAALAGYVLNVTVLSHKYTFEHVDVYFHVSIETIKDTFFNQIQTIGSNNVTYALSFIIWASVIVCSAVYLLSRKQKNPSAVRFVLFCLIAWMVYSMFSLVYPFGLVPWHLIPVAILFIPCFALAVQDSKMKVAWKKALFAGVGLCILFVSISGYSSFQDWPKRKSIRCNDDYAKIAAVLEKEQFDCGYATFWNANILTELTDGTIDVWSLNSFDDNTTKQPDVYQWLQVKAHDTELPHGKVFVIWTTEEYQEYAKQKFDYIGKEIFRSDAFVVFEVVK